MKKIFILGLFLILLPFVGLSADNIKENTYRTANRLFHIARSANRNLVCYDVNMKLDQLNPKEPLRVYWVDREQHPGKTDQLNYIQKKLAYGYKLIETNGNECTISLTAYPSRRLTIKRYKNEYACFVMINNRLAILQSLYVKAHEHNPLNVLYVELRGITVDTQEQVTERVKR